jgi:hypothetical protein
MMAAYQILDANGQFTPTERDKVRRLDRLNPAAPFAGSLDDARLLRGTVLPFQLRAP